MQCGAGDGRNVSADGPNVVRGEGSGSQRQRTAVSVHELRQHQRLARFFFPALNPDSRTCVFFLVTGSAQFDCERTFAAGHRLCYCDQAPESPSPPTAPPVPNRYLESDACFVPITYQNQYEDTVAWPLSSAIDSGTNDEYLAKIACIDSQQCTAITNVNTQLPTNNWLFITRPFDGSSAGTELGNYGARTFVKIAHGQYSCIRPSMPPSPPAIPPPCVDTGVLTQIECDMGKQAGHCEDTISQTYIHCQYTRLLPVQV